MSYYVSVPADRVPAGFHVSGPTRGQAELPAGLALELLLIELRQAFESEAYWGKPHADPRRLALRLLADGYSPETTRWLLREGRVRACIDVFERKAAQRRRVAKAP